MNYTSLQDFIKRLEEIGELIRIDYPVSTKLEITEITDRIVKKGGPALLFTNNGTPFPLLINAFGSERRICEALRVNNLDEIAEDIKKSFSEFLAPRRNLADKLKLLPSLRKISGYMPTHKSGKGACQEVIIEQPDLGILPVLTCWPHDGGPFITLPVVHTKDIKTGNRNVGMYRMQVMGKDITGMHWQLHKGSAKHFEEYKEKGQLMPVVVTLGGDPVYTYVATAPLPDNIDEYLLAGFIRKKSVQLVKAITCDIEIPADVDFVLEGYVDPGEEPVTEGPFGDHTGYYSLKDKYPLFHVKCITHRKNAVYPATIVGIPPQEDAWLAKATERIFIAPLKMAMLPEIIDMFLPSEGVFHNICIVKIKKTFPGQAFKVMNSLWGAGQMMLNKYLIVTGEEVNIHNPEEVMEAIFRNCSIPDSISIIKGPLDVLDHAGTHMGMGSKMGIDATSKTKEETENNFAKQPHEIIINIEILLKEFPEITKAGTYFTDKEFPLIIICVDKNRRGHIKQLHQQIADKGLFNGISFAIYFDSAIDPDDLRTVIWMASGNTDPDRDIFLINPANDFGKTIMGIDASVKNLKYDNFKRPWPNVIVSDQKTIDKIDNIWSEIFAGGFIPSPSNYYKSLVLSNSAEVTTE